jgi:hypothetical protein
MTTNPLMEKIIKEAVKKAGLWGEPVKKNSAILLSPLDVKIIEEQK